MSVRVTICKVVEMKSYPHGTKSEGEKLAIERRERDTEETVKTAILCRDHKKKKQRRDQQSSQSGQASYVQLEVFPRCKVGPMQQVSQTVTLAFYAS